MTISSARIMPRHVTGLLIQQVKIQKVVRQTAWSGFPSRMTSDLQSGSSTRERVAFGIHFDAFEQSIVALHSGKGEINAQA